MSAKAAQLQRSLAQACRNGQVVSIEGAREDRLPVYLRLVGNVMRTTLRNAYPMALQAMGEDKWKALVDAFCSSHDSSTPYLWRYPREIYEFVVVGDYAKKWGIPYLNELMEFEWVEIELFMMPDQPVPLYAEEGDLTYAPLVLNPEHRLMRFEYPVFRLPAEKLEAAKGVYFVVAFRHPETLDVEFVELTPPCALALERLAQEPIGNEDLWEGMAENFPQEQENLFEKGTQFTESMLEAGLILGFGE